MSFPIPSIHTQYIVQFYSLFLYSVYTNPLRPRLEFSREWNIPVHHFLRRHIYGASRPYISRASATALTFLISALLHELVMGCITKKLRGYGFVAMMLQLPIVALQRTRIVRGRTLFNNVAFWISMISGLSIVSFLKINPSPLHHLSP